jgi:glyoxylase-like metal-dependent hydrolase (beta-lactamase superfamily II)
MLRIQHTVSLTLLFLCLCTLVQISTAQDFDKYQVNTIQLTDNIYMMSGAGGNLAVCTGGDGVFLVDADYTEMSEKVKSAIAKISNQPVKLVFNTHWHFDHVGGNENFAKWGSLIAAHENVRKWMAADQFLMVIDRDVEASPVLALPVITFTDTMAFHFNQEEIVIFHPPHAHTNGDGVVYFRNSNVIHTGDIFFNCGYPFIDITHGGTIDGMIAAVDAILLLCNDVTNIIPGHGPLANKSDLETYLGMLSDFRAAVAKEMAAGKDLETIKAEKPTAAVDDVWGTKMFPPDLFTEMVFHTLDKP